MGSKTIFELLNSREITLTRSETQLSHIITQNYPVSGLGTITELADAAKVSTPTVARLVQKLGFKGFSQFQRALRDELDQQISDPFVKRKNWVDAASEKHLLNRFTKAAINNISQSLANVDMEDFSTACQLLADDKRRVFVVGGRITRVLADYFFLHMQVLRSQVFHVTSNANVWPHFLLDLQKDDVVVIFDIRRYENSTLRLAEIAKERGAKIILFTDQWGAPIKQIADISFSNHIVVPSAWDSNISIMLLTEIILADIQERLWENVEPRLVNLEVMFDRTRFFRKF